MKRLFRIFELTKNEQRVVLTIMLALIAIAFIRHQRRVNHPSAQPISAVEMKPSPSPMETANEQ
jgi:hypothetical protein